MSFLRVVEFAALSAFALFVITQMIIPPFIGKRFFWLFKKSEKQLMEKQSALMDAKTEKQAREVEKKAEKISNQK